MEPGMLGTFPEQDIRDIWVLCGVWQRAEGRSGKTEMHGVKRKREGDPGNDLWTH